MHSKQASIEPYNPTNFCQRREAAYKLGAMGLATRQWGTAECANAAEAHLTPDAPAFPEREETLLTQPIGRDRGGKGWKWVHGGIRAIQTKECGRRA